MKETSIVFNNPIPRLPEIRFKKALNWCIKPNEQWAIIGPNGAGKSIIAGLLQGKYALKEGEIINNYESISQAAKELNLDPSSISKVCKGKLKQTHGYKFRYAVVNNKE